MAGKILVVDDVATNRIILKAKLSLACYEVLQAADGPQALAVAAAARPDLILLDLGMPEMDGLAVLSALKSDPDTAPIPVIVVTGHADTRSRIAGLRAGAEDFLTKPVDEAVLAARVRSLLRDRVAPADLDWRHAHAPGPGIATLAADRAGAEAVAPGGFGPGTLGKGRADADPHRLAETTGAGAAHFDRTFAPTPPAPAPQGTMQGLAPGTAPGLIALVGPDMATVTDWHAALAPLAPHGVVRMTRAEALRHARRDARERAAGPPSEASAASDGPGAPDPGAVAGRAQDPTRAARLPDVFILASDIDSTGDGLMLLSELRAGAATRHAAILVALPRSQSGRGPMALDLGACDILVAPMAPEEMALRVAAQLQRKQDADAQRARLRDRLQMALTDPLTGLGNRRYALSHLARLDAEMGPSGRPYAVLLLDLDRFKQVNDRFGHAGGDAVLRCVADRLRQSLRAGDVVARFGGEEFLVALVDTDAEGAHVAAERLRRAIEAPAIPLPAPQSGSGMSAMGAAGPLRPGAAAHLVQTVSIGLAARDPAAPENGPGDDGPAASSDDPVAALIERADRALYAAKAAGRNCVQDSAAEASGEAAA